MRLLVCLAIAWTCTAGEGRPVGVPYGHPDFYPSPERPLGWRGDGTGCWPGAGPIPAWEVTSGKNIAWRTDTPGPGQCQPIVVGEKVFVTADPNLLCCYDVHDGKLLWQTAIDHTEQMPAAQRDQARAEMAFLDGVALAYARWRRAVMRVEKQVKQAAGLGEKPPEKSAGYDAWCKRDKELDKLLWLRCKEEKRLLAKGDDDYAALGKLLAGHPDLREAYAAVQQEGHAQGWMVLTACNGHQINFTGDRVFKGHGVSPHLARYLRAQNEFNLWLRPADNWLGWTTYNFATPVTDGERVYVTTANNAIAAVDLAGKVVWLHWEHVDYRQKSEPAVLHTRFVASPALLDGKLVVMQNSFLRVYEAASGEKLWETPDPERMLFGKDKPWIGPRPNPEATSPVVTTLPLPDGGRLPVVINGERLIFRLEDGHVLCKDLPQRTKGSTPIARGDLYLYASKSSKTSPGGGAVRMTAASRDRVTVEHLWQEPAPTCHSTTPVLYGDQFVLRFGDKQSPNFMYDVITGEKTQIFGKHKALGANDMSPVVAGHQFIDFHYKNRCRIADLKDGKVVELDPGFVDTRGRGDSDFALRFTEACGPQFNSSPAAQANRLFLRTWGILWCFGDPAARFPTPARCPAEARTR